MPAGLRLNRLCAAVVEGLVDLVVEIDAIRHQDDLEVNDTSFEGKGLGEHHHGQALAAALGMPDYAASARSVVLGFLHSVKDLVDAEVLLMAGDLFLTTVEEHKTEDQFEEPLPATQGIERLILRRHLSFYASIALPLSAPKLLRSKNSVDLAFA